MNVLSITKIHLCDKDQNLDESGAASLRNENLACVHALITFKSPMSSCYDSSVIQFIPWRQVLDPKAGWNNSLNTFVVKMKSKYFTNGLVRNSAILIQESCKVLAKNLRQLQTTNKVCKKWDIYCKEGILYCKLLQSEYRFYLFFHWILTVHLL